MSATTSERRHGLSRLAPIDPALWVALAALWFAGTFLCAVRDIHITGGLPLVEPAAACLALSMLVRSLSAVDDRLSLFLEGCAAYAASFLAMVPLAYVATRSPIPAMDALMRASDSCLGFDAAHVHAVVASSPILLRLTTVAYGTWLPQYLLALLILPRTADPRRGLELLRLSGLVLCPAYVLAFLLPTAGTVTAGEFWYPAWHALHDTAEPVFIRATDIQPIVSFPSFHASMAVLLVYSMRGLGSLSWLVLILTSACWPPPRPMASTT